MQLHYISTRLQGACPSPDALSHHIFQCLTVFTTCYGCLTVTATCYGFMTYPALALLLMHSERAVAGSGTVVECHLQLDLGACRPQHLHYNYRTIVISRICIDACMQHRMLYCKCVCWPPTVGMLNVACHQQKGHSAS